MIKLYIKTHIDTGLKYFGKTGKDDIFLYTGSGKYWLKHIKKHGYNVKTELYGEFYEDDPLLEEVALDFSIRNDIINNREWANLILENGLDGNSVGVIVSDETRKKISIALTGKIRSTKAKINYSKANIKDKHWNWGNTTPQYVKDKISTSTSGKNHHMYGKHLSEETKIKISQSNKGIKHTEEAKQKISIGNSGLKRSKETLKKMSEWQKGKSKPKLTCPHCGKIGGNSNMTRYHFNNCKLILV